MPGLGPPAMEAIILKLLAKLPNDRFASAREVASALAEAAQGRLPRSAVTPRHNLPIQLTGFIGRQKEIAEIKDRVEHNRLVTLTGSGGVGKTRHSLQVAAELLDAFPDGVWMVDLAPVSNPELVLPTLAAILGVREDEGRTLGAALQDHLQAKHVLVLLDNCEHLLEACASLAESLLRAGPGAARRSGSALGWSGKTSAGPRPVKVAQLGNAEPAVQDRRKNPAVQHGFAAFADVNLRPSAELPHGQPSYFPTATPIVGTVNLVNAVDAVGSRYAIDHEAALRRLEQAGATLVTSEMAAFELTGAAGTPQFKEISRLVQERMKAINA